MSGKEEFMELLGKKVKVIQKDGFVKSGVLKGITNNFLILRFNDGSVNLINIDFVASVSLGGENNE